MNRFVQRCLWARAFSTATPLSSKTLHELGTAGHVRVPAYSRANVRANWVHLGVGAFHRAHQSVYLEDLLEQAHANHRDLEWGVCGIGIREEDRALSAALQSQDCLYTVMQHPTDAPASARVIGAHQQYILAVDNPVEAVQALANPRVRVVSMTVTESGYCTRTDEEGTLQLNEHHEDVLHDLKLHEQAAKAQQSLLSGSVPRTVYGYLAAALRTRREANLDPFTLLCCDNLQHNGALLRSAFLRFLELCDVSLSQWASSTVSFPSCMVDRITPATRDEDRDYLASTHGVHDACPVVTEGFSQWVVEDNFCAGRPPLEDVDVLLVDDVAPFEAMKLQLLNASHFALAYLGHLAGFRWVHDVATHPVFCSFLRRLMEEVTPVLPPVPGVDLTLYKETLLARFGNESIGDTIERLCKDGSAKFSVFLLPSILAHLKQGTPPRFLALATAGWLRYLGGLDETGTAFPIDDPMGEQLHKDAKQGGTDPRVLLDNSAVFGDLAHQSSFVAQVNADLSHLHRQGTLMTLQSALTHHATPPEE